MQQRKSTIEEYHKRINTAVEYINNHLDEKIDLENLAMKSNFSPFHFHRILKAFLGEPIGAYILRVRVETAAKLLRYSKMSIQEIAYQVGYDTPSSLSKSFKLFYGISPRNFRSNKNFIIMKQYQIKPELDIRQREVILEDKKIIYINMIGDYKKNNYAMAWKKLWEYAQTENISINKEFICIYHDDPKVTQPEKQRTDVCLSYNGEAKPKGEISVKRIEAGKYIAFLYKGPYDNLSEVYDTIYGKMFPESGYEMALKPGFELYINDPSCTLPENLLTEIYVPVI